MFTELERVRWGALWWVLARLCHLNVLLARSLGHLPSAAILPIFAEPGGLFGDDSSFLGGLVGFEGLAAGALAPTLALNCPMMFPAGRYL